MREFGGVEPLVGAVRGLRTFRLDDTGTLLPLYSNEAWYGGTNTAVCSPPVGTHPRTEHAVPSDDCECGFYAYGTLAATQAHRQSRYVVAVVACWGNVVAGTRGFRAEHAVIQALWLAPSAPEHLRRRLAVRYPDARQYADQQAMLAEFPLTDLPCYEEVTPRGGLVRAGGALGMAAVLALGVLPWEYLRGVDLLWAVWLLATTAAVGVTAWLAAGVQWAGHVAAALVMSGVVAWLLAPSLGLAGWLLRMPLLRGGAVAVWGVLVALLPRYFPVVPTIREKAFCGVRPSG